MRLSPVPLCALAACLTTGCVAQTSAATQAVPALGPEQQHFLARFTLELQAHMLDLAPEQVAVLGKTNSAQRHPWEGQLTARQVMQQLLADYQAIGSALLIDNGK